MNAKADPRASLSVEQAVRRAYTALGPDSAALVRMEVQLLANARLARPAGRESEPQGLLSGLRSRLAAGRPRWALAALAVVLALALAVAVIGPRHVLASLHHLIGYLPGIGFVDEQGTRLLLAPVESSQGGMTISLAQLVAEPGRTVARLGFNSWSPSGQGAVRLSELGVVLLLSDGQKWRPSRPVEPVTNWGEWHPWANVEFPALPKRVEPVALIIELVPKDATGALAYRWLLPLSLHPAAGGGAGTPRPAYEPSSMAISRSGITVTVTSVSQTAEETIVRYRVEWDEPCWTFLHFGQVAGAWVQDEQGRRYGQVFATSGDAWRETRNTDAKSACSGKLNEMAGSAPVSRLPYSAEGTLQFLPIPGSPRRLTLTADALSFNVLAETSFVLDLGEAPEAGEARTPEIYLTPGGFPLKVSRAQLARRDLSGSDRYVLDLEFDVPDTPRGHLFQMPFLFANGVEGQVPPQSEGGAGRFSTGLVFQAPPRGQVQVTVNWITVALPGPWSVTWTPPGAGGPVE